MHRSKTILVLYSEQALAYDVTIWLLLAIRPTPQSTLTSIGIHEIELALIKSKNSFTSGSDAIPGDVFSISLLCNLSETFENIIFLNFLLSASWSNIHHRFVRQHSTVTNLACFTQFVSQMLDNRGQVDAIYLDFHKTFDQIDHCVVLRKLELFWFSVPLCALLESYLTNRHFQVCYTNFTSTKQSITLFFLFINHISSSKT